MSLNPGLAGLTNEQIRIYLQNADLRRLCGNEPLEVTSEQADALRWSNPLDLMALLDACDEPCVYADIQVDFHDSDVDENRVKVCGNVVIIHREHGVYKCDDKIVVMETIPEEKIKENIEASQINNYHQNSNTAKVLGKSIPLSKRELLVSSDYGSVLENANASDEYDIVLLKKNVINEVFEKAIVDLGDALSRSRNCVRRPVTKQQDKELIKMAKNLGVKVLKNYGILMTDEKKIFGVEDNVLFELIYSAFSYCGIYFSSFVPEGSFFAWDYNKYCMTNRSIMNVPVIVCTKNGLRFCHYVNRVRGCKFITVRGGDNLEDILNTDYRLWDTKVTREATISGMDTMFEFRNGRKVAKMYMNYQSPCCLWPMSIHLGIPFFNDLDKWIMATLKQRIGTKHVFFETTPLLVEKADGEMCIDIESSEIGYSGGDRIIEVCPKPDVCAHGLRRYCVFCKLKNCRHNQKCYDCTICDDVKGLSYLEYAQQCMTCGLQHSKNELSGHFTPIKGQCDRCELMRKCMHGLLYTWCDSCFSTKIEKCRHEKINDCEVCFPKCCHSEYLMLCDKCPYVQRRDMAIDESDKFDDIWNDINKLRRVGMHQYLNGPFK